MIDELSLTGATCSSETAAYAGLVHSQPPKGGRGYRSCST